jgi:MFS family permease
MNKTLTALAAAATIAVAAVAIPQQAEARHWGHGGAILGGLAAGAIIGGALAGPHYYGYYGGPYAYYDGPYGRCWRERVGTPYGWRWHRVCD